MAKQQKDTEAQDQAPEAENAGNTGVKTLTIKSGISAEKSPTEQAREFEGTYEVPDTAQGYIETFGEDVCRDLLEKAVTARVRAQIRAGLEADETDDKIQSRLNGYSPSAVRSRKSKNPFEDVMSGVDSFNEEQLAALRAKLAQLEG